MHAPNRFDPASVGVFRVTDRAFDRDTGTVSLRYALDDRYAFVETITFETPFPPGPLLDGPGLDRALLHLHVAAGTSYYKTAAPPVVDVELDGLLPVEQEFHRHLYDDGLREFAVANALPVPRPVVVRSGPGAGLGPMPQRAARHGGLVVPIGGGKDSMVLIEAVKHLRPRLFAVNPHPLVHDLAALAGLDLIVVRRHLDPGLADLNASGAFNGHVPITAIVSLIAVVGSFLFGYDTIAMAVERSASEETALVDGVPVNHQYSKSLEFEHLLADLVARSIDPALSYGSALRPYSELAIARAFARLTRYHGTFCSCNSAFRHTAGAGDRWCGHCPKCRFVALMLAPYLDREAPHRHHRTGSVRRSRPDRRVRRPDERVTTSRSSVWVSDVSRPPPCASWHHSPNGGIARWWPPWPPRARGLVHEEDVRSLLTPVEGPDGLDSEVVSGVRRLMAEGE